MHAWAHLNYIIFSVMKFFFRMVLIEYDNCECLVCRLFV